MLTGSSEESRRSILRLFIKLPILVKPWNEAKLELLRRKLIEYKSRLRALESVPGALDDGSYSRRLKYESFILASVLELYLGEGVTPAELAIRAYDEQGPECFGTADFYVACATVGFHLGIVFPDIEIICPPKPAMAA